MSYGINPLFLEKASEVAATEPKSLSLESLTLLVNKSRVASLEASLRGSFKEFKERQEELRALQSFLRALNTATDGKGVLDFTKSEELKKLYVDLDEKFSLSLPVGRTKFSSAERERLIENVKLAIDDRNIQNELVMQNIQQLNNERNESFQMARSILKTLSDSKTRQAQALAGR